MIYIILLLGKEPKKLHLTSLLHNIKHMWYTIGEQLAVNYDDLKCIEYNITYDCTKKLSEVLQVWIDKRTCEVSWRTIITVTDDPPIENKRVADEICEFLARSDIQNEYLSTGKLELHCVHVCSFVYLSIYTDTSTAKTLQTSKVDAKPHPPSRQDSKGSHPSSQSSPDTNSPLVHSNSPAPSSSTLPSPKEVTLETLGVKIGNRVVVDPGNSKSKVSGLYIQCPFNCTCTC